MWDWITNNTSYAWMSLAFILIAMEMMVPGAYLVWIGLAALVTGLLDLVLPINWIAQLLIFGVLSVVFSVIGSKLYDPKKIKSDKPDLNNTIAQLVGREAKVVVAIEAKRGKIKLGDTLWNVEGPAAEIGQLVRITGGESNLLTVELA